MDYRQTVEQIQNKRRFGKAYGRDVTRELMERLHHPEHGMQIIHIAGTNGKGSTAAFVSSILQAADFVVGRFTSPHLITFRERIVVNGEMISQQDVVRLGQQLLELPMEQECTMFDLCLGMAMLYFKEKKCDFVVLETGLGGAKDSTTGLDVVPVVSAFTNMGFDHVGILGNTIEQIAEEKAGILKKGTVAVCGVMNEHARQVIISYAEEKQIPTENVDNLLTRISTWKIPLNGGFQRENAALAVGVVETIFHKKSGYLLDKYQCIWKEISEESCVNGCDGRCENCETALEMESFSAWKEHVLRQGIEQAIWPGRMEILEKNPYVLVDGAHNPQGVEALFNSLQEMFPREKFIFLVGVMADKDYVEMMQQMCSISDCFLTVTVESERSLQGKALAETLKKMGQQAKAFQNVEEAIIHGEAMAKDKKKRLIIFGSLYFVGEVKKWYEDRKNL